MRRLASVGMGILLTCVLAGGARADGPTSMKKGKGGSEVQGAAGTGGAQDASSDLEHCDTPLGAVAVVEPDSYVLQSLMAYNLQSPTSLIRLMIQQSNCFLVVERGVGMQNMMQERALAESGELRQDSNVGGGQMVTADFILTPSVVFSEGNAGGMGGGVGRLFRRQRGGATAGALAGGVKFKEAQTTMLLADARSGLQVAAAEGSAKKADLRLGGLFFGGGTAGALGGYANTNEGKVIAASLMDNYNGIVAVVRNDPSLRRQVGTLAQEAAAATKAGDVFNEGEVLRPKIANVKLLAAPSDSAEIIATLDRADEMIFMGEEQAGFVSVETSRGGGWVKKVLIAR